MDLAESIRSLEERMQQLKERLRRDRDLLHVETLQAIRVVEIHSEKARNAATEALAEIRHLDEQLREIASAVKTSPEGHDA